MTVQVEAIDLADPDLYATGDMWGVWRYLQERHPVFWNRRPDGSGFWALTRHRDAVALYYDTQSFTSERGMTVVTDAAAGRAAGGRLLITTDDPRHRQIRDVMGPVFAPKAIAALEHTMREVARRLLDRVRSGEPFDFVDTVAAILPSTLICQLLGVPREDWDLMIELTSVAFGSVAALPGVDQVSEAEKTEAHANIFLYYRDLLKERRRNPGDDIVSRLAHGRIDGRPLTDQEVLLNLNGVVTGGSETTRHSGAGAVIALIENPGEWERLRRDPSLLPTAVEEVLRWTAPSLHVMRTALRDTTVAGQRVRAGERVSVWHPPVNRDEEAFPDAERFDVGRSPNKHLTFGLGLHFCIGATLTRLELQVLLDELRNRVEHMELAGPVKRLRSAVMWGVDRVPVRFEMRDAR
jgi:cytochrome P450